MTTPDHYAVLGVSPDAEDVVIKAAYRALAQRYHPDKNTGDPAYSRQRMSELNEAYRILGDPKLRAEYDKTRSPQSGHAYQQEEPPEQREAFEAALAEMEDRWAIAVSIYPDLKGFRTSLARISYPLAFGFVAILLECKEFGQRERIAKSLERNFLERFFGSDPQVIAYAKDAILIGDRKAALALNRLVDVMGSGVDAKLLIKKVEAEFGVRRKQLAASISIGEGRRLFRSVCSVNDYRASVMLAELVNYEVVEGSHGLFSFGGIKVTLPSGQLLAFDSKLPFVEWAKAHFQTRFA
jgi:curved DNA-binding protein CbpA